MGKRPMGPVFRGWDEDDDEQGDGRMETLQRRWAYLTDGASLGAMLAYAAKNGTMEELAAAIRLLDRDQLEAACFAVVLVNVEGAPIVDDDGA